MPDKWEKPDFEALNKAAGKGLRVAREHSGFSKARLGRYLGVSTKDITVYEDGTLPIPAAKLLIADRLFRAGGLDFFFWPHSRPELQNTPTTNVIRFPKKLIQ